MVGSAPQVYQLIIRCCVGSQLVDWVIQECNLVHSRQQAVGMWQVLIEEQVLKHGKLPPLPQ